MTSIIFSLLYAAPLALVLISAVAYLISRRASRALAKVSLVLTLLLLLVASITAASEFSSYASRGFREVVIEPHAHVEEHTLSPVKVSEPYLKVELFDFVGTKLSVYVDPLSVAFAIIALCVGLVMLFACISSEELKTGYGYGLLTLLILGIAGVVLLGNLSSVDVFYEISFWALFFLALVRTFGGGAHGGNESRGKLEVTTKALMVLLIAFLILRLGDIFFLDGIADMKSALPVGFGELYKEVIASIVLAESHHAMHAFEHGLFFYLLGTSVRAGIWMLIAALVLELPLAICAALTALVTSAYLALRGVGLALLMANVHAEHLMLPLMAASTVALVTSIIVFAAMNKYGKLRERPLLPVSACIGALLIIACCASGLAPHELLLVAWTGATGIAIGAILCISAFSLSALMGDDRLAKLSMLCFIIPPSIPVVGLIEAISAVSSAGKALLLVAFTIAAIAMLKAYVYLRRGEAEKAILQSERIRSLARLMVIALLVCCFVLGAFEAASRGMLMYFSPLHVHLKPIGG